MTPKEKAKELVYKFDNTMEFSTPQRFAKQCALVTVDEILKMVDETMQGWLDADIIAYWKQVKEEIEKL